METFEVEIKRIRYPSIEKEEEQRKVNMKGSIFYIIDCESTAGPFMAKGEMTSRPAVGESYRLQGRWTAWNGQRQFAFNMATIIIPTDERNLLHIACNMTSGIGPVLEQGIWDACGERWRDVQAGMVKGLNAEKLAVFHKTIAQIQFKQEETNTLAWLIGHRVSENMAKKAWEKWQGEAIQIVKANCYRLAELPNYGFTHVDGEIRRSFGIDDTDKRRLHSAVLYCMGLATAQGDTVVSWYSLERELMAKLPGVEPIVINRQVAEMFGRELIGFQEKGLIAFYKDYRNEAEIINFVKQIADEE